MLARGKHTNSSEMEMESWLCKHFGIPSQPGYPSSYPIAPLSLLAEGIAPEGAAWMRADPIFLTVERDQLILAEASSLPIDEQEAQALIDTLNRHFSEDGLEFVAASPKSWYLRLSRLPAIETHSLHATAGQNIHPFLPTGPDARQFRSLLNEAQMLLFEHPVNLAREQRGLPPVNSVWLWGAGTLPQAALKNFDHIWSADPLATGLGLLSGAVSHPLPAGADDFLSQGNDGKHLIVFDQLRTAWHNGDPFVWREQLAALEKNWFDPLKRAVTKGKLSLSLHLPRSTGTSSFTVRRQSLLRFWLPKRRLTHYRDKT
ncbi:MAG: hypothetical protein Q8O37_17370 [Sulfuricellaceae bacterium]|nr:hypothetical protein [Sulfuricellaceae bacterium]